jgi:hypothetical protein
LIRQIQTACRHALTTRRVKQELQAEAANLRNLVAEQGAQVAALQQHAHSLEGAAQAAQSQVGVAVVIGHRQTPACHHSYTL